MPKGCPADQQTVGFAQLSTVDFAANNAAGTTLTLGNAGNAPRIFLTTTGSFTVPTSNSLLSTTAGTASTGWATVNGVSFATHGANGIADLITTGNDARITRVGRFLRFMRIDEVPQLFNVLRGEMALIGPRPEAAKLSNWYQAEVPFYRYRHIVRPGITGWAQVNQGHVADLADIKKKLEYDFYYIRNFSIWLDILIVMKTIKTVLTGFGHK